MAVAQWQSTWLWLKKLRVRIPSATRHFFSDGEIDTPLQDVRTYMIKNIALKHIKFVDPTEMSEIKSNKKLLKKLKAGLQNAKAMKGKFIGVKISKINH